ncbi:calcium/proton exchanger [Paracoccidioides brasiliensis]|nr:calcium/proton exchanger [Paracoccidioides brasiliensis]
MRASLFCNYELELILLGLTDIHRRRARNLAWYDDEEAKNTPNRNPFKKFRHRPVRSRESRVEDGLQHTQTESESISRPEKERQEEMVNEISLPIHANTMPFVPGQQVTGCIETALVGSITSASPSTTPQKDQQQDVPKKGAPRKRRFFEIGRKEPSADEPEDTGKDKQVFTTVGQLKATLFNSWINVLLIMVPVGIVIHHIHVDPIAIFVVNFIAILPLAAMLSYATEEIALRTGETLGGLLNATFGNAVELIVSLLALFKREIVIVQTSLIGSMLSNLLLVLGMAFFLGGFNRIEQNFNVTVAHTASSLLALAVGSLIIPTAFHAWSSAGETGIAPLSRGTSVILLVVYGAYLFFQLKSHTEMYNKPSEKVEKRRMRVETGDASKNIAQIGAGISASMGGGNAQHVSIAVSEENEEPQLTVWVALFTLAASTALVALCAEAMVGSIDSITSRGHISETFVGLILIPIVGNAAEHATAITVAIKDKMDLSIGVAVGSSMQIALLVLPLIVVIGWIAGIDEMTLYFDGFQIAILFVTVLLVRLSFSHSVIKSGLTPFQLRSTTGKLFNPRRQVKLARRGAVSGSFSHYLRGSLVSP